MLKSLEPGREVFTHTASLEPGSVDCILCDGLEQLCHRGLLAPTGIVLCYVPNPQHWSVLARLLRGDYRCSAASVTYAAAIKILLDCRLGPSIVGRCTDPPPEGWFRAAEPMLRHLGLHGPRTLSYLSTTHYVFAGTPLGYPAELPPERPLSFVVCVSDEGSLRDNLLSSPCLQQPNCPHEVIAVRGCRTAAEGLNQGLRQARHDVVVCLHQDVYLPRGWPQWFWRHYEEASRQFGPIGVMGVFGASCSVEGKPSQAGHVVDRDRILSAGCLPAPVDTLDELLLAVPRGTGLSFDPNFGFHFYGADICLSARQKGLTAVAIDALCFHNSLSVDVPPAFVESGRRFAAKWRERLPVATPCVLIAKDGTFHNPLQSLGETRRA